MAAPRFMRASLELDNGTRVGLTDMRALSTVELFDKGEGDPELGPEPSDPAFNADTLGVSLARRRGAIKPALLDQKMVAGIGNIYSSEALWLAKISPKAKASSLSAHRRERLIQAIREVLSDAPAGRYGRSARRRAGTCTIARARNARAAARRSSGSYRRDDRRTTVRWIRRAECDEARATSRAPRAVRP